jgi:hypothetical protein
MTDNGFRLVWMVLGLLLILLGAMPLCYIYAFASMVPPNLEGQKYWAEVLSRMFNFSDAGYVSSACAAMILGGLVSMILALFAKRPR